MDNQTTHFNDTLSNNQVVVGIKDKYTDNNGHEISCIVWDGNTCEVVKVISGYTKFTTYDVDASLSQIELAKEWWVRNHIQQNMVLGSINDMKHLYSSTVILQRSRKAPNKVVLKVTDWHTGYVDNYGNNIQPQVCVSNGNEKWWVSYNCVKQVVTTAYPNGHVW